MNAVDLKPDFVAADLGCGSGYFTVALAQRVRKVYGVDVQKEMLDFLAEKIKRLGIKNIQLLLSKANKIPLEPESVDLLISINTLHEFDDKNIMIREIRRVIKRGGRLMIVDFKKLDTGFGPPVNIRISEASAVRLFTAHGLVLVNEKDLPCHYLLVFAKN